jgi:adenylylsulfate kinase
MLYKRTLLKGCTWELSGIITLTIINLIIFGRMGMSLTAAAIYGALRIGMYYAHERIWKKINWFKPKD